MLEEKLRKMDKTDPNDRNLHGPMKISILMMMMINVMKKYQNHREDPTIQEKSQTEKNRLERSDHQLMTRHDQEELPINDKNNN